jgi:4'-phosphopantetheinyl transferase
MTTLINHMWLPAPCDLTLLQDDVHVWRIELDQPEAQLQSLLQTLSSDERSRAERFYQKQHRHRFIAGRGILRCILGRYLNIDPSVLKFNYEPLGKPVLADTYGGKKLWFNLSHSQGLALCAVSCDRLIGVDLEYIRPISDVISLAEQFFSTSEYALMRSLPPSQKQQTFFRYWTCKEAYLKATGAGLAQLDKIEVSLTPGQPASLQAVPDWSLLEMEPAKNCVAAIAVAGFGWYLKCWQY